MKGFRKSAATSVVVSPSTALRLLEVRVLPEFCAFWLLWPWLSSVTPRGDGHPVLVLPGLLAGGTGLMAHPGTGAGAPKVLVAPVTLAIGPEGGWVEAEVQSLQKAGLQSLDLGPRILRTETALAALVGKLF